MSIVRGKNFIGCMSPKLEFIADTYIQCNFSHPEAITDPVTGEKVGVPIFQDTRNTPRQFIRCNLVNCDVPPGSLVESCNTAVTGEEKEIEIITVKGKPVEHVRRKRHVAYGHYDHKPDGSVVYETFPGSK